MPTVEISVARGALGGGAGVTAEGIEGPMGRELTDLEHSLPVAEVVAKSILAQLLRPQDRGIRVFDAPVEFAQRAELRPGEVRPKVGRRGAATT